MIYSYIALREKRRTGSALAEFGFIPKGSMRKTVGCPYKPEAQL